MPIYEYQCDECGKSFEKFVRFSEADQTQVCPKCQGQLTHKKLSKIAAMGVSLAGPTSLSGSCGSGGGFS